MRNFFRTLNQRLIIELALLLDYEGIVSNAWRDCVCPSSYLVDQNGQIRYTDLGALEWNSPENITIMQRLLRPRVIPIRN